MEESDLYNEKNKEIIDFLNKCNIVFEEWYQLEGQMIPRELLISEELYKKIKDDLLKIKKYFPTSSLTSMQSNAEDKQRWCLLNLVRQILRINNYNMVPVRKADGYDKNKKKKKRRFFKIEKFNIINHLIPEE